MNSNKIRNIFIDFFKKHEHQVVSSAPIVVKNDPTLMFTNAGMNQFKDWFLGNENPKYKRVTNTQKCLRVSGKHNDLEEVGVDHYHHTMFEMVGNWSFGDYFKKEAIAWSWNLLTEQYNLEKSRMYVTVFEGDNAENLAYDTDSFNFWKEWIDEARILKGNKKDNFWEMGETGPCGPCSEIHYDMRSDEERIQISGATLVNKDHPEVIEIWNLVFMEFNRKADGSLVSLPAKHVDTGMGFERLTRVIQQKKSNYDTDIFQPLIQEIENICGIKYKGTQEKSDIAFRVIADHIRAIAFTIADGQLPSSNGAGYVVRRILRRAVRYAYSFLDAKTPILHKLIPVLSAQMGSVFPELKAQEGFLGKVVFEEEHSFLKTLERGMILLNDTFESNTSEVLDGKIVFELYDTFGFPLDLTRLIAGDNNKKVDEEGFAKELQKQKERSRADAKVATGDWIEIIPESSSKFNGYDNLSLTGNIVKYRAIQAKDKEVFQIVLNQTPFYPEGGGQVGDVGMLIGKTDGEEITVLDTRKENNLILHFTQNLPRNIEQTFIAKVDEEKRNLSARNHSATHLLHAALRKILGTHVAQKGSLVTPEYLRFDFSHFSKVSKEELEQIESLVNNKINKSIALQENREISMDAAIQKGAMALFGEKYGDKVRMITFDENYSVELCGGTHVSNTAQIGLFKIVSESAVAAGVRRIEAISSVNAFSYLNMQLNILEEVKDLLQSPKDVKQALQKLKSENNDLKSRLESLEQKEVNQLYESLISKMETVNNYQFIVSRIQIPGAEHLKNICFRFKNEFPNSMGVLGCVISDKPMLAVFAGDTLLSKGVHAGKIISELAVHIHGGGGGQAFFATAGGNNTDGLEKALSEAHSLLKTF
jgi:alanyl-tRNA synthetase